MAEEDPVAPSQNAELVAIEIGDWPPLGGDIRLEISGQRTVLVGRNGAGKSALLEGIHQGALRATTLFPTDQKVNFEATRFPFPGKFRCEVRDAQGASISYEYSGRETLDERCWRPESNKLSWRLNDGVAELADGTKRQIPGSMGLLGFSKYVRDRTSVLPSEIAIFSQLLSAITHIPAGVPRHGGSRSELVVTVAREKTNLASYGYQGDDRIGGIAVALVMAQSDNTEPNSLNEFVELGRRLGAWQDVRVEIYDPRGSKTQPLRQLATVSFDGIDIGLLADGTLRVAEILWALVDPWSRLHSIVLIEEPETGIHPGLLAGLLDTIDAYSVNRHMLVSTHSPQVVSWATPQELRLVERQEGKTQVRSLSEQQVSQVIKYLHDRTLGEYVYSGALDD